MNQQDLVEKIVAEVKRALALRGIETAPDSSTGASPASRATSPAPAAAPTMSVPAAASTVQSIGSRDLTGKQVITQRDLEAYHGQTITVTQKAVITPLAKDYAREKGITITKTSVTPNTAMAGTVISQPAPTVAVAVAPDFPNDSSFVLKFLAAKGFQIKEFTGKSYEKSVTDLSNTVSANAASFGICIEKSGMEGPIYANRNRSIRAAHCRETLDARAARVDIGANVIVINAASNPEAVISGYIGL